MCFQFGSARFRIFFGSCISHTLPETNTSPQKMASQKEISLPTIHFQVRTLSFREGICLCTFLVLFPNKKSPKHQPNFHHRFQGAFPIPLESQDLCQRHRWRFDVFFCAALVGFVFQFLGLTPPENETAGT